MQVPIFIESLITYKSICYVITITQKETWPLPVESVYYNKGDPIFKK